MNDVAAVLRPSGELEIIPLSDESAIFGGCLSWNITVSPDWTVHVTADTSQPPNPAGLAILAMLGATVRVVFGSLLIMGSDHGGLTDQQVEWLRTQVASIGDTGRKAWS